MAFKVGDVKKFLSPKVDFYEIKEVIENPNLSVDYELDGGICPDCHKRCKIQKHYTFKRIYVMENNEGDIGYKGETSDGELVRIPDNSFQPEKKKEVEDKIKLKSDYMKEK